MIIIYQWARTAMLACERSRAVLAPSFLALSGHWVMVFERMLAQTFQILRADYHSFINQIVTDRHVVVHFAGAFRSSAVYFPFLNVIEEVIFEPMTAEALRARPDRAAVLPI